MMNVHKLYNYLSLAAVFMLVITACKKEDSAKSKASPSSAQQTSYPSEVVSRGGALTKVTDGYSFDTAGSPLFINGVLYFTNNNFEKPAVSRTLRRNPDGRIDTLAMDNGVTTTLQASGNGTIYACEMLGHRVVELDTDGNVVKVVADTYNGARIDGPNDIVVDSKGGLYFSDSQFIAGGEKKQETPAVYYVDKQGKIRRVIDDIAFPNGMGLSPDGATLYVANTAGTHLLAYDVNGDGSVSNKRDFAAMQLAEGDPESGADGMAVDREGNIYVATTKGLGVQVFNSEGKHLGNISTPTPSNNVSFGGEDKQTMYIAAKDGIYSLPVKVEGL